MTDRPNYNHFLYAGRADRGSPVRYIFGAAAATAALFGGFALLELVPAPLFDAWPGLHLFTYLLPIAVLFSAVRFLHGRPIRTVLGRLPSAYVLFIGAIAGLLTMAIFTSAISNGAPAAGAVFADPVVARFAALILAGYFCQVLAEEILFRGYILQGLARVWTRPVVPILISAILFGVFHIPGYLLEGGTAADEWLVIIGFNLPWPIAIGFVFGVWAVLGGNVWLPTLCHLFINASFLLIDFGPAAVDGSESGWLSTAFVILRAPIDLVILGLFTLILFPRRREIWNLLFRKGETNGAN